MLINFIYFELLIVVSEFCLLKSLDFILSFKISYKLTISYNTLKTTRIWRFNIDIMGDNRKQIESPNLSRLKPPLNHFQRMSFSFFLMISSAGGFIARLLLSLTVGSLFLTKLRVINILLTLLVLRTGLLVETVTFNLLPLFVCLHFVQDRVRYYTGLEYN